MAWQVTNEFLEAVVGDISNNTTVAHPGVLVGAKAILYKNTPANDPNLAVGDLTLADFGGYASKTVTLTAGHTMSDGGFGVSSQLLYWQPNSTTLLPQEVAGIAMVDSTAATLYAYKTFDEPVAVQSEDSAVQVVIEIEAPLVSEWGTGIVIE